MDYKVKQNHKLHEDCIEIIARCGTSIFLDYVDYPLVNKWTYSLSTSGYPRCTGDRLLHRQVMCRVLSCQDFKGLVVDHIDGDPLNNRRCNLRLITQSANTKNRKLDSRSSTGEKGVICRGSNYRAIIMWEGTQILLGVGTKEECTKMRRAIDKFIGEAKILESL